MANQRVHYKMRIEKIIDHTTEVRELIIRPIQPDLFKFRAGQFVTLHVPQDLKPALRAYSIASTEANSHGFNLLFKKVEGGVASTYVWSLLGFETLEFTGPFGRVFFKEPPTEQIVMINTGTGISQHYSYLVSFIEKYPDLKYRMLFGLRFPKDIYFQSQLLELKAKAKNFDFQFVISRPDDSWSGKTGYVQNHIDEFAKSQIPTTYYLCGNGDMIKDVKKLLLETYAIDKAYILSEAFN